MIFFPIFVKLNNNIIKLNYFIDGQKERRLRPSAGAAEDRRAKKAGDIIARIESESNKDAVRRKSEVMPLDTERLLTELFDFQRFERDPALGRVIDEVAERLAGSELSEDELDTVSAAGDPYSGMRRPGKRDGPE